MKEGCKALPWVRVVALQVPKPNREGDPEMHAKGPSAQPKAVVNQPEQKPQGAVCHRSSHSAPGIY